MSIGQRGMMVAAKTLSATAIDLFKHPSMVEAARKDFGRREGVQALRLLTPPKRTPPIVAEPP
jgi:aminobenzoyl-glutamate utilization protein B